MSAKPEFICIECGITHNFCACCGQNLKDDEHAINAEEHHETDTKDVVSDDEEVYHQKASRTPTQETVPLVENTTKSVPSNKTPEALPVATALKMPTNVNKNEAQQSSHADHDKDDIKNVSNQAANAKEPSFVKNESTNDDVEDLNKYKPRYHTPELTDIAEEDDQNALPEWVGDDAVSNINTDFKFDAIDKEKDKQHFKDTGAFTATAAMAQKPNTVPSETGFNRNIEDVKRKRFTRLMYAGDYGIEEQMENLGYNEESVKKIRGATQQVTQYFLDTVASLIMEICAFDGVMSPVICTDISNKPLFYKSVYQFIMSSGYPYKYARGAAELNANETARLHLLNFLLSEYQSCKMIGAQELKSQQMSTSKKIQLNANSKAISKYLGNTCNVLSIYCPDSAVESIKNIEQQIKTTLSKLSDNGKGFIGSRMKPLLHSWQFDPKMLRCLEDINNEFSAHYKLRKNVLWKRMQVTIECMLDSDRAKRQKQEISKGLNKRLSALDIDTQTDEWLDLEWDENDEEDDESTEDEEEDANDGRNALLPVWIVFAAQKDVFRNDTITCITSDIESQVRKIRIGPVPDRGGRANEVRQVVIDNIPFSQYGGGKRGRGRGGRGRGSSRSYSGKPSYHSYSSTKWEADSYSNNKWETEAISNPKAYYGYDSQVGGSTYDSYENYGQYQEPAAPVHVPYRFQYYAQNKAPAPRATYGNVKIEYNTLRPDDYVFDPEWERQIEQRRQQRQYEQQQQQQQRQYTHQQYAHQQQPQQQQQHRYYQAGSRGYQQARNSSGGRRASTRSSGTWYNYPSYGQY